MATPGIYEEVEIEDLAFDAATALFSYPCPCGDKFVITLDELLDGDDVALCPSCTLRIKVIFEEEVLDKYEALYQRAQVGELDSAAPLVTEPLAEE